MSSILDTCRPRPEIISGSFNPEVFTASLSPIIRYYRQGRSGVNNIYTDARLFFNEATYPTQGLRQTLGEVFTRIAGDGSAPSVHRLETSFGGGKTHTLIACTHIAHLGTELEADLQGIMDPSVLPTPGSVHVVGIAGDELPVHKPHGDQLIPYTLWGEIAYQIGGAELYLELGNDVTSYGSPGLPYLEKVFNGRKVLIMMDELAQYAARLEAAHPEESQQLAAFLMALFGYVRNSEGIAIILTLAGSTDAFSRQTAQLARLLTEVKGVEVSEDEAQGIMEAATVDVTSVVARDAVQVVPVQAAEISSVFAKRLFLSIDRDAAKSVADEYIQLYQRNRTLLPEVANREIMSRRLQENYPFHPTLVDYLTNKLTSVENFQGTRGVLRVLALAVRSLWNQRLAVPMIHACHLDMRSDRVVNELLGRTGSSDLLFILNADIGSIDTENLEGGRSNSQQADDKNPHPSGFPLYEHTWKTVFLHSLVGRSEGLRSPVFGISESEAMLAVSFPGLTPPQVKVALDEIKESAYYLRHDQGRYYASPEPTINNILARIRRNIGPDQADGILNDTARRLITSRAGLFHVESDAYLPEHIADGRGRPVLGVVPLTAGVVDIEAMITTKGEQRPREQQNLVFILVPDTVAVRGSDEGSGLFNSQQVQIAESRQYLETIARQVLAMQQLADRPQNWAVDPRRLAEPEYRQRRAEREQALATAVATAYNSLYYPSTNGHVVRKEIRSAGGEGGVPFIETIKQGLLEDGEMLTAANTTQSDLVNISALFFEQGDTISLEKIKQNFNCKRDWPVLEESSVLEQIIRAGVRQGSWCLYGKVNDSNQPEVFFDREHTIPLGLNLSDDSLGLVTLPGAKKRNWAITTGIDVNQLRTSIINEVVGSRLLDIDELRNKLNLSSDENSQATFQDSLRTLVKAGRLIASHDNPADGSVPQLIHGSTAVMYTPQTGDILLTVEEARARGWYNEPASAFILRGTEAVNRFKGLLKRIGSIYNRGATTTIDSLDISGLRLPGGGELALELTNATPADLKALDELLEMVSQVSQWGEDSDVYLEIREPDAECPFMRELNS